MAAVNMINGLAVHIDDKKGHAVVEFLTTAPIPFFKVTEEYKLGEETTMQRRDMRRGEQRAVLHTMQPHSMKVEVTWEGEVAGRVEETFFLEEGGTMVVRGVMDIGGKKYDVRQVYVKE